MNTKKSYGRARAAHDAVALQPAPSLHFESFIMVQINVDQNKSAMFTYLSRSRQAERRDSDQSVPLDRGRGCGRLVAELRWEMCSLEESSGPLPISAMHAPGPRGFLARTAGQAASDAHHGTGNLVTDACFATGCGMGGPGARSASGAGAPTKTALPRWAGCSGGGGGPGRASEALHQTRLGPGSVTMSAGLDWVPRGSGGGGASVESENHIVCWSLDVMRNWMWIRGRFLECLFGSLFDGVWIFLNEGFQSLGTGTSKPFYHHSVTLSTKPSFPSSKLE